MPSLETSFFDRLKPRAAVKDSGSRLQLVKEGGVLLRRSAFFFCIWERKEEKAEKNRQKKSAAMSARRAF